MGRFDDEFDQGLSDAEYPQESDLDEFVETETPTVDCPSCGAEVADVAPKCPNCGDWMGAGRPGLSWKRWQVAAAMLALLGLLMWVVASSFT